MIFTGWLQGHAFQDHPEGNPTLLLSCKVIAVRPPPKLRHWRDETDETESLDAFAAKPQPENPSVLASARPGYQNSPTTPLVQNRLPALPQTPHYREAALLGDNQSALSLVTGLMEAGTSLTQVSVTLIQPAMYQIGQLWQENRVSVAQEHLATAVSQNVLARAYMRAKFAEPNARRAVFACVPGNRHSLGLRMLSDAFETAGWESVYLGADMPIADLLGHVDAGHPDLLALSLSLPGHLDAARQTIARLRAELGGACPDIWIGGVATLGGGRVWRMLAADGWAADAQHALEQLKT